MAVLLRCLDRMVLFGTVELVLVSELLHSRVHPVTVKQLYGFGVMG